MAAILDAVRGVALHFESDFYLNICIIGINRLKRKFPRKTQQNGLTINRHAAAV